MSIRQIPPLFAAATGPQALRKAGWQPATVAKITLLPLANLFLVLVPYLMLTADDAPVRVVTAQATASPTNARHKTTITIKKNHSANDCLALSKQLSTKAPVQVHILVDASTSYEDLMQCLSVLQEANLSITLSALKP